jgi:cell division protein FtsZ
VRTIMNEMGVALMGTGVARGDDRAEEAARMAISSPLLEDLSIDGAHGVLINITGGTDLTLYEVNEASTLIQEAAHEDANIIFGAVVEPEMKGKVKITVIATGFDRPAMSSRQPSPSAAQTPVDLHSYASWKQESTERVAAAGGGASRMSFSRRPVLDLPPSSPRLPEVDGTSTSPGAEFEPVSPLDVPAFLRRQSEG